MEQSRYDALHAFSEEALYTNVKALSKKEMQSQKSWEGLSYDTAKTLKISEKSRYNQLQIQEHIEEIQDSNTNFSVFHL